MKRFELSTLSLECICSTPELHPRWSCSQDQLTMPHEGPNGQLVRQSLDDALDVPAHQ